MLLFSKALHDKEERTYIRKRGHRRESNMRATDMQKKKKKELCFIYERSRFEDTGKNRVPLQLPTGIRSNRKEEKKREAEQTLVVKNTNQRRYHLHRLFHRRGDDKCKQQLHVAASQARRSAATLYTKLYSKLKKKEKKKRHVERIERKKGETDKETKEGAYGVVPPL